MYCLVVPNLAPGDLVRLDAQMEATNTTFQPTQPEEGYIMEFDAHLAVVNGPLIASPHTGQPVSDPAGKNITPYEHHSTIQRHAWCRGLTGDVMFSLVVSFATETGQLPATARIEKGYGRLSALVARGQ